ncbi:MAG: glycosyltransferase [Cyanobacteriota bacterium]|nr:glycosyltransferase [Cyanobacteriota bacterium]
MSSLCLAMIVKNEAHVLGRCLASVKPLISAWLIVDTGSSDGTQSLVAETLSGIPGRLEERPWRNFGVNRTEALQLARSWADYSLVMDADDWLELTPEFVLPPLQADAYFLSIRDEHTRYQRLQIFNNRLPWRYEGVLHEYPVCEEAQTRQLLTGITYCRGYDGASWKDPEKYRRDAALLESALQTDPYNARYVFYLAQSYRDAQLWDEALTYYQRRVLMGGWAEEVYQALLQIPQLLERKAVDAGLVWAAYLRAYHYLPQRAEALCYLARYCRQQGEHTLAHLFAAQAMRIPLPPNGLFIDEAVYTWQALDEYAIAAYWVGNYLEAISANQRLLTEGSLPASEQARVQSNLVFCLNAIGQPHQIESQRVQPQPPPVFPVKAFSPQPLSALPNSPPRPNRRVAVITPYFDEPLQILRQCHESVVRQSVPCEHIMVADGIPRSEIDGWAVQHIKLPKNHNNKGDTPRAIGGALAVAQGFDAITFLDADNWYQPDHLASLLALHETTGAEICTTARTLHRLDGSLLPFREVEEGGSHVDSNCLMIFPPAFRLFSLWGHIPQPLSPIDDRIIWQGIQKLGFRCAFTGQATVAYRSRYASHYRAVGEPPPANAFDVDWQGHIQWWQALSEPDRRMYCQRLGFDLVLTGEPTESPPFPLSPLARANHSPPEDPVTLLSPFLQMEDWLPEREVKELLDFVSAAQAEFVPAGVTSGDPGYRQALILHSFPPFADHIRQRVRAILPEVCAKLGIPPFAVSEMEAQLTVHGNGDFFKIHPDNGAVGIRNRVLSYVYYFHHLPKRFTGGELRLYDSQQEKGEIKAASTFHLIQPRYNSIVFFPSYCWHEVLPIQCGSPAFREGRLTINGWLRHPGQP